MQTAAASAKLQTSSERSAAPVGQLVPYPPREAAAVLFTYWGRRGLSRLALDVARTALSAPNIRATFSVARQNERFAEFSELGNAVVPVNTFSTNAGAALNVWRIGQVRTQLSRHVAEQRTEAVIELMPHVWSSFVMPSIKAQGARYVTVVHDAETHPGDHRSSLASRLVSRAVSQADLIITLSEHVAGLLRARERALSARIRTVCLPDMRPPGSGIHMPPRPGEPWRLLFLGRILPYKGLPLFVELIDELVRRGIAVEAGVFGEGPLGSCGPRLLALGAEIVNRWLSDAEIDRVLARYHAVVLSHVEASQSGVAAVAFGAGVPVIATPVGGLVEQIEDGTSGVLAARADALALADAASRLLLDPALYRHICDQLISTKERRSAQRFVDQCVFYALER